MKRVRFFLVAVALLVVVMSQSSNAAILNVALRPGINTLNDRDVAFQSVDLNGNGLIDVGDQITTLLIVENISNSTFGATPLGVAVGDPTYQLTALIVVDIATKVALGGGIFDFTGEMTADVYEDNSAMANTILVDFASQARAAAIAAGTDGSLILMVDTSGTGAGGTPDTFRVIASDDLSLLTTGNEANFIAATSVIANPMAVPIAPDATLSGPAGVPPGTGDFHDVVAVGEEEVASPAVSAQGWEIQSDTSISFTVRQQVIPELASFAVWGVLVGLGGLFALSRQRNKT